MDDNEIQLFIIYNIKQIINSRIKERKGSLLKTLIWLAVCIVVFLVIMLLSNNESSESRGFLVSTGVVSFIGVIYYMIVLFSLLFSK